MGAATNPFIFATQLLQFYSWFTRAIPGPFVSIAANKQSANFLPEFP